MQQRIYYIIIYANRKRKQWQKSIYGWKNSFVFSLLLSKCYDQNYGFFFPKRLQSVMLVRIDQRIMIVVVVVVVYTDV